MTRKNINRYTEMSYVGPPTPKSAEILAASYSNVIGNYPCENTQRYLSIALLEHYLDEGLCTRPGFARQTISRLRLQSTPFVGEMKKK